ncbi:MAG TPA: hypothetical protein PJ988_21210 [Anaerolinea sp.]|nr:hypothetical protein [Anaerolinea sp.]
MKRLLPLLLAAVVIMLAACNTPDSPLLPAQSTATLEASATPTLTDTPTPIPGKALLFAGGSADPALSALVSEQAGKAGLTFETRDSLQPADLGAEVKLVVAVDAPANLAELLAAAPQAQFVVASRSGLQAADNLTVLQMQPEQQAFTAGLVATLISDAWRAAGLIPADAPRLQDAFANGGRYYCGVCSPGWPLGVTFPLVNGAAAPGDGAAWAAVAADFFDNGKAESFYLSAAATKPEVITYLAGRSQFETAVKVVGELPPPDELRAQWAATVGFDLPGALAQALPTALSGKSAGTLAVPISLSNINPDVFSPGRQEVVRTILSELEQGIIPPLSVPPE